jgi:uncharacterized protein (DUF2126 family)
MTTINNMHVELRSAIEPWHVLGEESGSQGTSRYVDSSLERVQIKVSNFVPERYVVTCNGVVVPLTETGVEGEFVSGVKYKAWEPWSALHPTVGTDTPLVFDIVDSWNRRSIGGLTYHVAHPGGRSYDTFPVNSYEAESRRINRFWDFNHTQGEMEEIPSHIIQQTMPDTHSEKRVILSKHESSDKVMFYQDVGRSNEYPYTLDMRRKWAVR